MAKAPTKSKGKVPAHLAKHTFKAAGKTAAKPVAKAKSAKKPSEMDGHEHLMQSKHFSGAPAPRDPGASTKAPKKNDGLAAMADGMSKQFIGG